MSSPTIRIDRTHQLDMDVCQCDWIIVKIRQDDAYAQNFYAALCNQSWVEQDVWQILGDRTWSVSWRTSAAIVADIRGSGDYLDWYCSGMIRSHPDDDMSRPGKPAEYFVSEGIITDEVRQDLEGIGWRPILF